MKRLIRTVLWVGAVAAVLWLARSALKSFVDGPEVTPASGGWPDRAGGSRQTRPTTTPDPTNATHGATNAPNAASANASTNANANANGAGEAPASA
ncbi:MAG TPA: hypothetical protein VMO88_04490, partial [Acidimicrobiales bacterium]|nr:hypothetical protein [Acidimicrobiales bacterium]